MPTQSANEESKQKGGDDDEEVLGIIGEAKFGVNGKDEIVNKWVDDI